MKILIGLGNIGDKYLETRHNVGFIFLDKIAHEIEKQGTEVNFKHQVNLKSFIAKTKYQGKEVLLVKPTTLMNLSGEATSAVLNYFKASPSDIITIYDDIDIPLGTIRVREKGSAGTHNGMKSIIQYLKTDEFQRIRIGIESRGEIAPKEQDLSSFVLSNFLAEEIPKLKEGLNQATKQLQELLK